MDEKLQRAKRRLLDLIIDEGGEEYAQGCAMAYKLLVEAECMEKDFAKRGTFEMLKQQSSDR